MKTNNFLNALYIMAMAAVASASRAPHFRNSSIAPGNDLDTTTPYGSNSDIPGEELIGHTPGVGSYSLDPAAHGNTLQDLFFIGATFSEAEASHNLTPGPHNAVSTHVRGREQEGQKHSIDVIASFAANATDHLPTSALRSPEARQGLIEKLQTIMGDLGDKGQQFVQRLMDGLKSENWPEVRSILNDAATFIKEHSSDPTAQASVAGVATLMFVVAMYANPELLTHMRPTLEYDGEKPVDKGNRQEASKEPATEPSSPEKASSFSLNALNPAKLLKLSPYVLVPAAAWGFGNLMQSRVQGNMIENTISGAIQGGEALANMPSKTWDWVKVNGPSALTSVGEYLGSTSDYEDIPRDALSGHFPGATSNSTEWGNYYYASGYSEAIESGKNAYNSLFEQGVEQDLMAPNTSSWDDAPDDAPILAQVQDTIDKLSTLVNSKVDGVSQFATEVLTQAQPLLYSIQQGAKEGINAAVKSIAQSIENLTSKIQDNTGLTPELQAALGAGATILIAGMFAYRKDVANAMADKAKQLKSISRTQVAAVSAVVLAMHLKAEDVENFFGELASVAIALPGQVSQMFTGWVDIVANAPYREMANAASLAVGTALSAGIQGIATDLSGPATAITQAWNKIGELANTLLQSDVTKELGVELQKYAVEEQKFGHLGSEFLPKLQKMATEKLSELYTEDSEAQESSHVKTAIETLIAVAATLTIITLLVPVVQSYISPQVSTEVTEEISTQPLPTNEEQMALQPLNPSHHIVSAEVVTEALSSLQPLQNQGQMTTRRSNTSAASQIGALLFSLSKTDATIHIGKQASELLRKAQNQGGVPLEEVKEFARLLDRPIANPDGAVITRAPGEMQKENQAMEALNVLKRAVTAIIAHAERSRNRVENPGLNDSPQDQIQEVVDLSASEHTTPSTVTPSVPTVAETHYAVAPQPAAQNSSSAKGQTGESTDAEIRKMYEARLAIRDQIQEEVGPNQSPQELRNKDVSLFDDTPSTAQAQDNALSKLDETMARIRAERNQASAEAQTSNWLRDTIADRRKNSSTKDRLPTIAEGTTQELEEDHGSPRDTLEASLDKGTKAQTPVTEASTHENKADPHTSVGNGWKKGAAVGAGVGLLGSAAVAAFCFNSLIIALATAIPTFGLSIPIMAIVMAGALIATGTTITAGIGAAAGKAADSFQDKVQDQGPSPEPGSSR